MFRSTENKGFVITFDNGYSIAVQFSYMNYCDIRYNRSAKESATAEIAIFNASNEFVGQQLGIITNGDDVEGWCTPERVLKVMNLVQALNAK